MRIILIAPPPWKIAGDGEEALPSSAGGPPRGRESFGLSGDFLGPPYGLLLLASQAKRAGHEPIVINLSNIPWTEVERTIAAVEAPLFGISCFTANRRGASHIADAIRKRHPLAHIVMGGPHVSALPVETLEGWSAVDTVVIGEGERTLLEVCDRLERDGDARGIAGTAWRTESGARLGAAREPEGNLDRLAPLHRDYKTPFFVTSRGCPGRCTFCSSQAMWGKGVRSHSAQYVLDTLEIIVERQGHPLVAFKDDTFTARRRRVMEICEGIQARGLSMLWSCDTRADALVAGGMELATAMRRAGCLQVSLGVESGSAEILERLNKRVDIEQVRQATELAKSVGMRVRFYVMLGCPGETKKTLEETFALIRSALPHHVVFTPFSTYPGTDEFRRLVEEGHLKGGGQVYFNDDFWTPTFFADVDADTADRVQQLLRDLPGIGTVCRPTADACRAVVKRQPDVAANHMDLGIALYGEGDHEGAAAAVDRALELGYPLTGVGENLRACLALARGDVASAREHLGTAAEGYPLRHVSENIARLDAWEGSGRQDISELELEVHPRIEIAEEMVQPLNPGPLDRIVEGLEL